MTRLSVNLNKVATLRNSRGGTQPNLLEAMDVCLAAGVRGVTLHPRADERHVRRADVLDVAARLRALPNIELNLEGDPRPDWVELVLAVKPAQATLVPVFPGEITSQAGWPPSTDVASLGSLVRRFRAEGIRTSLFVDPDAAAIDWAASVGADRVELYTEPYARAHERSLADAETSFERYAAAAERAHARGLGVNAGHDLDLDNLGRFLGLPHLAEVSIGHAIIARALFHGLERVVGEYLRLVEGEVAA